MGDRKVVHFYIEPRSRSNYYARRSIAPKQMTVIEGKKCHSKNGEEEVGEPAPSDGLAWRSNKLLLEQ